MQPFPCWPWHLVFLGVILRSIRGCWCSLKTTALQQTRHHKLITTSSSWRPEPSFTVTVRWNRESKKVRKNKGQVDQRGLCCVCRYALSKFRESWSVCSLVKKKFERGFCVDVQQVSSAGNTSVLLHLLFHFILLVKGSLLIIHC